MKTETKKGSVASAYGNPLPKAIDFTYQVEMFSTKAEVESEKELPTDDEIVQWANAKRTASARAAATTAALSAAGIEPPAKDDPKVLTRNIVNTLVLAGKSEDEAHAMAKQGLGANYVDIRIKG